MNRMRPGPGLPLIALAAVLGGCAPAATRPDTPPAAPTAHSAPAPAVTTTPPAQAAVTPQPKTPKSELSSNVLFTLLLGEFAGQRGVLTLSAREYLSAARMTHDPRIAQRATHIAIYGRDYDTALDAAQLWVETDPQSYQAHQSLAALLLRTDDDAAVLAELRRIIKLGDTDTQTGFHVVSKVLANDDDTARATKMMHQLLADYPKDPYAELASAEFDHHVKQDRQALATLEKLLVSHPKLAEGWVLRAKIEQDIGRHKAALGSIERAVNLRPDDQQLRLAYARLLVEARELDKARQQFRVLEKSYPDKTDILYALGLLAEQAGDLKEAEHYFQKMYDIGERADEAAYALGQVAEQRKDIKKAIYWYSQIEEEGMRFEAGLRIAVLTAREGDLAEAQKVLRNLPTGSDEDQARVFMVEGELYREAKRYEDAQKVYDHALEVYPDNPELLYARAMNAEKLGRFDILERDLKTIIDKDPHNAQALNALGYTLADRNQRLEEAYGYIKRAHAISAKDPAILDSMGWVLYRLGRPGDALVYLRQAVHLITDPEVSAHYGEVLWAHGDKQEARKVWETARKKFPHDQVLRATMKRFGL